MEDPPRTTLLFLAVSLCLSCGTPDTGADASGHGDAGVPIDSSPADQTLPTPDRSPPDRSVTPDQSVTGPKALPKPTQPCPTITEGLVTFLGVTVRVWVNEKATAKGPLILYWHGTSSNPLETIWGLGQQNIDAIKSQGGLVAAPKGPTGLTGMQTGGVVWRAGDYALADEILACAIQQVGIDPRRIHSVGMSAGGLHTAQMSYTRSGYLASVTTYSGGLIPAVPPPPSQDPANKLPAMIMHGGDKDVLGTFSFKASSERYLKDLQSKGHFAFICDHGQGHWLAPGGGAAVWRFFQDHPYGTNPSPYQAGLPASIPAYCTL